MIETGLQMTHMSELADKDFSTAVITVLKRRGKLNDRIENSEQRKETFKNNKIENTTSEMRSKLDRLTNRMDTTEEEIIGLKIREKMNYELN